MILLVKNIPRYKSESFIAEKRYTIPEKSLHDSHILIVEEAGIPKFNILNETKKT